LYNPEKEPAMLLQYIQAAMRRAKYEILPDDGTFYGHIPDCQGVWANEPTLEGCRESLQSTLEDWILFSVERHQSLPVFDGLDLAVGQTLEVA
jgi:predicted RNase H-like HicB family nuclease